MAAQLDYGYSTPKGVAGGKVDISFDDVITRTNEEKDGVLKYGMAAMVGTSAGSTVKVPAAGATAEKIEGIVLHAANTEQDKNGKVVVPENGSVGILRFGKVWARVAKDVEPKYGDSLYVVLEGDDAGTLTNVEGSNVKIEGKFIGEADNGIAPVILTGKN